MKSIGENPLILKQYLSPLITGFSSLPLLDCLIVGVLFVANLIKWTVFGKLNQNEIDNLKEKIGYTIWEFWFGFFIFLKEVRCIKNDASVSLNSIIKTEFFKYSGLFLCVSLLKSFHFLLSARTYSLSNSFDRRDESKVKQFKKLGYGILLINCIDLMMIGCFIYQVHFTYNSNSNLQFKHNILIAIFGFEIFHVYPLLCLTGLKYYFTYFELEAKALNIIEIYINLIRLTMTGLFAGLFLYSYTFPFHILPSSYLSLRVLIIKIRCLISQELKNVKFGVPLVDSDSKCAICFDFLDNATDGIQYLGSCDHNFHYTCLKHWLVYSNECPICRSKVR